MPPVRHRMPSRISWLIIFAVGILSPTSGKKRADTRVLEMEQELDDERTKNEALVDENRYLRDELYRTKALNNWFQVQDEMNDAVNQETRQPHTTSRACPDMDNTIPMSRLNPTTICPN